MKKLLSGLPFITIALLISACATPKFKVVKVGTATEAPKSQGVFYHLAQTRFDITVNVTKIERVKGPYSEFAGKYLGLSNVINQNSTLYILDDIVLEPVSVPDPTQYYFIEMGKNSNPDLVLSASGMLLNTTGKEQNYNDEFNLVTNDEEDNIFPDVFKYFSDLNLFEQVDTIIERVNMDTITIEKMSFRRTMVEKTPEQKASDAADFIIKVKENRLNLISGYQEVNYDKETFTLMNEELEKLESEYQKLFTGLTFTKKLQYHYSYLPSSSKETDSLALFKFSDLLGIIDTSNANGTFVTLLIKASGSTDAARNYVERMDPDKFKQQGYYYRIPEHACVIIRLGNKERFRSKVLVNQFGLVNFLPARDYKVEFFPENSGIHTISIQK